METNHQERVEKTLDVIRQDRIIPEDPWFYARLVARMENETERAGEVPLLHSLALRLRPVLAMALVVIGIAGGILAGRALSSGGTNPAAMPSSTGIVLFSADDANAAVFREISSSVEEKLLFMK